MNKRTVLSSCIFFIVPILGGVSSFLNICRRDISRGDVIILSSFFFIIGYSTPPVYDLYRHYNDYEMLVDGGTFLSLLESRFDFILYVTEYLSKTLGLNFGFIPGIYAFVCYYIMLSIYRYYIKKTQITSASTYVFLSLLVVASVPLFTIVLGLRFGFGIFLALYASFLIYERNNKIGFVFFAMAVMCHYSFLLTIISLVANKLVRINKSLYILMLILAVSLSFLMSELITLLPISELFKGRLLAYLTGYWAEEFLDTYSLLYRISLILTYWMIYPGILYYLLSNNKSYKDRYVQFTLWNIIILLFFCNYEVIFSRYALFVNILIIVQFVRHFSFGLFKKVFLFIFVLFNLVSFVFGNLYANRTIIEFNNMNEVIFIPPIITLIKRFNYDNRVLSKIDDQGRFL